MKFIEDVKNPVVFEMLRERLIEEADYPLDTMIRHLQGFMLTSPERMFVETLWDDKNQVKAFLIAYIPIERSHVFILQAWESRSIAKTEWPGRMFGRLKEWAIGQGATEIRAESKRSPRAFLRKWNFETLSRVLSYNLREEMALESEDVA